MAETSDTVTETPEVRDEQNVRHIYPSKLKSYLLATAMFLVVGAGLGIYIAICISDIRKNMTIDELKSRSPAHQRVLDAYYHCMGPQSPGHLACLGAVSKGAELSGIKPSVVKSVLVEAGLVQKPVAKDPSTSPQD